MSEPLTPEAIVDAQMREWERVGITLQEPDLRDTLLALAKRIEAAARKPLEERVWELEEALRGLREAADRYRQDVAAANEYLNQDLPSVTTLVWALGKASAALSDTTEPLVAEVARLREALDSEERRLWEMSAKYGLVGPGSIGVLVDMTNVAGSFDTLRAALSDTTAREGE